MGGRNEQAALGNDYDRAITICIPKRLHNYFTRVRPLKERALLRNNAGNIESLARGDDLETRMYRRLLTDIDIINEAFDTISFEDLNITRESVIAAFKRAHAIYLLDLRETFENKEMTLFQGLASFKARNVLHSAEKSSVNLAKHLNKIKKDDDRSTSYTQKVALYLTRYLREQNLSFQYAYSIIAKFSKNEFSQNEEGIDRNYSESTIDQIQSQLSKSRQKVRAVFTLLDKINFDRSEELAEGFEPAEGFIGFEEVKSMALEVKDFIFKPVEREDLHTLSWEEIDDMGGILGSDRVDNKNSLVIHKNLKLFE